MEKKFNWLGWLIILMFVVLDTLLFIVGTVLMNNTQEFGVYIASTSLVLVIVGAALIPTWYRWGLGKLLPARRCNATVVWTEDSYITFDLPNSNRIVFKVPVEKRYTILMGESGSLTYKHQGKYTYFISFERNMCF